MVILRPKSRWRGTIVHEAALAIVLAAIILASMVQVLTLSAQQSRSTHQRLTATREAGDVMEQLMARSYEQLTTEAVHKIEVSDSCLATLPNPQLDITIESSDTEDDQGAKQLNVSIGWQHRSGNQERPVQLVAWKYPRQEASE